MTKCFLLGAGASLGYSETRTGVDRPPSSTEFFSKGEQLGLLDDPNYIEISELLDEYNSFLDDRIVRETGLYGLSGCAEPDIERVMIYQQEYSDRGSPGLLAYYIYDLLRYYSWSYDYTVEEDNYQLLARHYRDSPFFVISLNYDILFERAMRPQGFWPVYRLEKENWKIPIAKIHGSINMVNRINRSFPFKFGDETFSGIAAQMYRFSLQNTTMNEFKTLTQNAINYYVSEDLLLRTPYYHQLSLIPPTGMDKSYTFTRQLAEQQRLAASMLSRSDELVVVGSQVRPEDELLHELIRKNLDSSARITLAVGSEPERVRNNIAEQSGTSFEFNMEKRYFGDYIRDLV